MVTLTTYETGGRTFNKKAKKSEISSPRAVWPALPNGNDVEFVDIEAVDIEAISNTQKERDWPHVNVCKQVCKHQTPDDFKEGNRLSDRNKRPLKLTKYNLIQVQTKTGPSVERTNWAESFCVHFWMQHKGEFSGTPLP